MTNAQRRNAAAAAAAEQLASRAQSILVAVASVVTESVVESAQIRDRRGCGSERLATSRGPESRKSASSDSGRSKMADGACMDRILVHVWCREP